MKSKYVQKAGFMSQLELNVLAVIEKIIPPTPSEDRPIAHANYVGSRPSFLKSPRGGRMEIDIWIPTVPLAVEVQGQQHYRWSKRYFREKSDWDYYVECDKLKERILWEMGIPFLVIKYNENISLSNILSRLKKLCKDYPVERVNMLESILEEVRLS